MNKWFIIVVTAVLLLAVGLSGCNEVTNSYPSEESRFVGTWEQREYLSITFFLDETCSWLGNISGKWEIKDGKLEITFVEYGDIHVYDYSFSNNDNSLTLTNVKGGGADVYNKK
ncbi:MAG: hypothetical protein JSW60_07090 [Thermoplasmatales archaeon]|nr:MAG: hypothetical protein JSW60_07090 [Thermoplasmatales archaeon]